MTDCGNKRCSTRHGCWDVDEATHPFQARLSLSQLERGCWEGGRDLGNEWGLESGKYEVERKCLARWGELDTLKCLDLG